MDKGHGFHGWYISPSTLHLCPTHIEMKICSRWSKQELKEHRIHCANDTSLQVVPMDPPKLCCFQWNNSLSKYLLEPSPSFWIFVSPWPDFAHLLAVSGSVWSCPLHIKIIKCILEINRTWENQERRFHDERVCLKKNGYQFLYPSPSPG